MAGDTAGALSKRRGACLRVVLAMCLWTPTAQAASPTTAAVSVTASSTPEATLRSFLETATGYNLRQRALRDAWLPLFMTPDDCDRMMILLARKVSAGNFAGGVLHGWSILSIKRDDAYGFARATVRLRGRNDWWWPKRVDLLVTLKEVDNRWLIKGPKLKNIDLQEPQGE